MKKRSQIILVGPHNRAFIKNDIELLSRKYSVVQNVYDWRKKYYTPLFLIHQFFAVLRQIRKVKAIVIEFGGYWSVTPTLLGKLFKVPVFIVLHGTDCAALPNIQYGVLRKKFLRLSCKLSYNHASMLLPVSDSLIYSKNNYNSNYIFQGVHYHLPSIRTPYQVVPNGVDSDFWKPENPKSKDEKRFMAAFTAEQIMRKGGDLIISIAKEFSDCSFYIAGADRPESFGEIPDNVHFLGKLTREELREEFRLSRFHLQLSMFEGFGLALCEAMLCECVPIGSSVNVIPDIIGSSGFILKKKNEKELFELVERALASRDKEQRGQEARKRIMAKFPVQRREELLIEKIESA